MKIIKAKVKLHLMEDSFTKYLEMKLKLQGELFYWHSRIVVDDNHNPGDLFYEEVIKYISNIENIKKDGEYYLRKIIEDKAKDLVLKSKEKQAKKLLEKLNKPIEIEVKE